MHDESQRCADQEGRDVLGPKIPSHGGQHFALADRFTGGPDHLQGYKDKSNAKQNAASLAQATLVGFQKQPATDGQQEGHQPIQIKRQNLNDKRRAEIRAKHNRQTVANREEPTSGETCGQQRCRGGALQYNRQQHPHERGLNPVALFVGHHAFERWPHGALNAGLHHANGEQKQHGCTGEVQEKGEDAHAATPTSSISCASNSGVAAVRTRPSECMVKGLPCQSVIRPPAASISATMGR